MRTVVIESAQPIVTPADVAGDHGDTDQLVAAIIEAATEAIDGPSGWLGRCLGPQLLEQQQCDFLCRRIRYVPVIAVESIEFYDRQGTKWFVPPENYRVAKTNHYAELVSVQGFRWPTDLAQEPDAVRIRYRAGYDDSEGIGPVPQRARQAIILAAQQLISVASPSSLVRSEGVEGVGTTQYLDADRAAEVTRVAAESLLNTLRIIS
ncbi:hypothetical protein [Brucella tritici]|uniref:hypothetical protein n=1 Tax=Brucella tritici TaxID=94626 RepID=UPI003D6D88C4